MSTGPTGPTGSTGPWGQQGAQGFKGPRGVVGATGYGYGITTGPTGAIGWPGLVSPAADTTYLTTTNIGTINVITGSNIIINMSGLISGNAGAFWTFSNATLSNRGVGGVTGGGSINVGGTTQYSYTTTGGNLFTLVYDGTNLLPM